MIRNIPMSQDVIKSVQNWESTHRARNNEIRWHFWIKMRGGKIGLIVISMKIQIPWRLTPLQFSKYHPSYLGFIWIQIIVAPRW